MNLTNRIFNIRIALFAVLLIAVGYLSPPANAEEDEWKLFLNEDPNIWDGYTVNCFLEDGAYMWLGTSQGLVFKVLKETLEAIDTLDFFANDMAHDLDGNVWFGGSGLKKLVGDTLIGWDQNNYQEINLPDYIIRHISVDSTGNFWLGIDEKGLVKFDGQTCKLFDDTNAPFKRFHPFQVTIQSTAVDKNNNIWVTAVGVIGVLKYDHKEWTLIDSTNSNIKSSHFEALAVDNNNEVWVGTSDGIYKYDGTDWVLFKSINSEIKGKVIYMNFDRDNNLWCSADNRNGLIKYDGINWTIYNQSNSPIFGNSVGRIYVDKKQNIWFAVSHIPESGEQDKGRGVNIYRKGGVILDVYDKYELDLIPLLYPNPSEEIITISNIYAFEYYEIFDLRGFKVLSGMLSSNLINISELTTGSYSIILRNNNVSKSTFFIKY